jgi:hypothetical protein
VKITLQQAVANHERAVELQHAHGVDYGAAMMMVLSDGTAVAEAPAAPPSSEPSAWNTSLLNEDTAMVFEADPSLMRRVSMFGSVDDAAEAFGITNVDAAQLSQMERKIEALSAPPPPPANPHAAWLDARPLDGTEGRHFPRPYSDEDFHRDALRYEAMVAWAADAQLSWSDGMPGQLSRAEWELHARMGKDPVTEVRAAAQQHFLNREQHGRVSFIHTAQDNRARERTAARERQELIDAEKRRKDADADALLDVIRRSPGVHPLDRR